MTHTAQIWLPIFAPPPPKAAPDFVPPDLLSYDFYIVLFSGGKDCTAAYLHLRESGVPNERILLLHHPVDGQPDEGRAFFDWPCTPAYTRAFAQAFDLPIYEAWRTGGFRREMLKENDRTAVMKLQMPDGSLRNAGGVRGRIDTRRKFPQVTGNMKQRWCSGFLKVHPGNAWISAQTLFHHKRVLVISGERAEESPARAAQSCFERHDTDAREGRSRRHVDHWRAVHNWSENRVWSILERWSVRPHPCYFLFWSRCSCAACIFNGDHEWATFRLLFPLRFAEIARYEQEFGLTIHRSLSVTERADRGTPFPLDPEAVQQALTTSWNAPILLEPGQWHQPPGAFRRGPGPT